MFDPGQLKTFLVVVQTRSFTQAAERLGVRQSTVSDHVRKLERTADRRFFHRDTHTVRLTSDGEVMIGHARNILEANERAMGHFAETDLRGTLRLGVSEDFALSRLPEVLRQFRHAHPRIDVELTVGLSGTLHETLHMGELDLVLGKRLPGQQHGQLVWREPLVWACGQGACPKTLDPVPLIVYPPPSITRVHALESLDNYGMAWRVTCTSESLNGLRAAALAGLGVTVHALSLVPPGMVPVPQRYGLPDPGEAEFVLSTNDVADSAVDELVSVILRNSDRLR